MNSASLLRSVALLLFVLAAGPALSQDGPPADLLAHVKVGQRWTFEWTMGDQVHQELWHVAEVHEGDVRYVQTTRVRLGEKVLSESVAPELQQWTAGARPVLDAAALALAKATQRRDRLQVPGVTLDCVVTQLGDVVTWTAVRGDHETFPGVVKLGSKDGDLRVLAKVEDAGPPKLPERRAEEPVEEGSGLPKGALDHVKVGQRWVFRVTSGGMTGAVTKTVTEVNAAEGRVLFRAKTVMTMDGAAVTSEEQEAVEWSAGGSPVLDPNTTITGVTGMRRQVEVAGMKLDAYSVVTAIDDLRSEVVTAVKGDREVFPGVLVQRMVGVGGFELLRVEGP